MGNLGVVVVAAGKGSRMGTTERKQYLLLREKPIIVYALETFQAMAEMEAIVVVVGAEDVERTSEYVRRYGLTKVSAVVSGGEERQHSVYRGLQHLDTEWVLVHDGVRPFITAEKALQCWQEAHNTGAAVLAVPVKDTIKVADSSGCVASTPDRRSLWAIQTPQAFRLSELKSAHEHALAEAFVGTDDASLIERLGRTVRIVEGDYRNLKITTPDDLELAEFIMGREGIGT
jgi:2-C-methyl-D-erythritol 4-phosphate cytidylyltransferase